MYYCENCDNVWERDEVNWGGRYGQTPVCPDCCAEVKSVEEDEEETDVRNAG